MRIAVYAGSFDPITNGHLDIVKRAANAFDKVIVLLAVNPDKQGVFTVEERLAMIKDSVKGIDGIEVDYTEGLTVDYCKKKGARHIIRGLRAVTDFEYEFSLAAANKFLDPDIDMVFFMSNSATTFISSSMINQLRKSGADIAALVPSSVVTAYEKKGK